MDVSSSWPPENGIKLCDIVQELEESAVGDLVDLLDENKCVSLVRVPELHPKECSIRFVTPVSGKPKDWGFGNVCRPTLPKSRKLISGMKILSESRVMEICIGTHEEYFTTVHGDLVGDFGDSKMYVSEVKFDTPPDVVLIKLKGLCVDDSVWIYGLHVSVTVDKQVQEIGVDHYNNSGPFSREHLSSVFKDKGVHLSKDADKFRQMLEGFNSGAGDHNNKFATSSPNAMALMSMMFAAGKNKKHIKECELDYRNGNNYDKKENLTDTKEDLQMSKFISLMGDCLSSEKEKKLSANGGREYKFNHQNKEKDLIMANQMCIRDFTHKDPTVPERINGAGILQPHSNIMETLQNLSNGDQPFINDLSSYKSVIDMLTASTSVSNYTLNSADSNDKLHKSEKNEESGKILGCKCGRSTEDYNGIKSLVDEKITAMEERLMKKIEEKFEEHSKNEGQRLKKIEELLTKINEKL